VVEGSQAATDKQVAEIQAAQTATEAPPTAAAEETAPEGGEDISMEDVLGGAARRKQPEPAEAAEPEARHAETHTI